jgi:ribonuclease HepT-like protein
MIDKFTAGMDFETFRSNPMAVAAVERKLLTISDAAVRLSRKAPSITPQVPRLQVHDPGNWYDRSPLQPIETYQVSILCGCTESAKDPI